MRQFRTTRFCEDSPQQYLFVEEGVKSPLSFESSPSHSDDEEVQRRFLRWRRFAQGIYVAITVLAALFLWQASNVADAERQDRSRTDLHGPALNTNNNPGVGEASSDQVHEVSPQQGSASKDWSWVDDTTVDVFGPPETSDSNASVVADESMNVTDVDEVSKDDVDAADGGDGSDADRDETPGETTQVERSAA